MTILPLLKEAVRSGTIASLMMMPVGFLFKWLELRVGHYGPKFAALFFDAPSAATLFMQHLLIGWLSAIPLLLILARIGTRRLQLTAGVLYGIAYYVAVNSLALPLFFKDPLPWKLGLEVVYPSLLVHLVFGLSISMTAAGFLSRQVTLRAPSGRRLV